MISEIGIPEWQRDIYNGRSPPKGYLPLETGLQFKEFLP